MIYLDYTANTPADPDVLDAYLAAERRYIANPNSTHIAGQEARAEMERVTQSIAQHLGVQPAEIIYTSGASEANNLALKGIAHAASTSSPPSWSTARLARRCRLCSSRGTRSTCWTLAATAG